MDQDQPRANTSATIDPDTILGGQTHPSVSDSPIPTNPTGSTLPSDPGTPTSDSLSNIPSSSNDSIDSPVTSTSTSDSPVVSSNDDSPTNPLVSSSTSSYTPIVPSSESLDSPSVVSSDTNLTNNSATANSVTALDTPSVVVSPGSSSPESGNPASTSPDSSPSVRPVQYTDIKPVSPTTATVSQSKPTIRDRAFKFNKTAVIATVAALSVIVAVGIGSLILTSSNNNASLTGNNKPVATNYKPQSLALGNITGYDQLLTGKNQSLQVNGKLSVADSIVLSPSTTPTSPTLGQLYYNATTNTPYLYNGKSFISLIPSVGGTIAGASTSLSLGSGLGLQGSNLVSTGVTSLSGTPNQIIASASNGSIRLSLPTNLNIAGNFTTTNGLVTNSLDAGYITGNGYGITDINPDALPSTLAYQDKDNTFTSPQTFKNSTNSTDSFSIQDASGNTLLNADTTTDSLTVNNLLPETPGQVLNGITTNAIISNVSINGISNSVIGSDGFVQFAYSVYNNTSGNYDLHLVHCTNATCTTYTDQVVVTGSDVNGYETIIYDISIALDNNGFARIVYGYQYIDPNTNNWDYDIDYVDCTNADCSANSQTTIAQSNGDLQYYGYGKAIAIGSNGFPQIVYGDYSQNQDVPTGLFLASCTDSTCSSTNTTTLVNGSDDDYIFPDSIVFANDGFLRVLYNSNEGLSFLQCTNTNCTSPVITVIDSSAINYGDLAIGSDGLPVIVYTDGYNGLTYAQCTDASCSTSNTTVLDSNTNAIIWYGLLAIGSDGFARISYINGNGSPAYIDCTNAACSGATPLTVDNNDVSDWLGSTLVLGSDGLARIIYSNQNANTINFALFGTANGQTSVTGTNIGSESSPFGTVYAGQIHTTGINTSSSGQLLVQGTADSSNAFTVQDAAGNNLLNENSITKTLTVSGGNGGTSTFTGEVADIDTDSCPTAVAISGTDAYVVNSCSNTLEVFNISNPANPTFVSDTTIDNDPYDIAISGNYVYVTGYDPNTSDPMLLAYDVSDPTNPTQVGSTDLSNLYGGDPVDFETDGDGLSVSSNTVYLLTTDDNNDNSMLTTYNITDPTNITPEGSVATDQGAWGITNSGNYAYVTNNDSNTLEVFNISDPNNPTEVADVPTDYCPTGVTTSGADAYVVNLCSNTLEVYDISDPTNPTEVADVPTDDCPADVTTSGTDAYVVNQCNNNLEVYDISDPTNPTEIADTSTDGCPYGVAVSGNDAYVTNNCSNTLQVFDISSSSLAQWGVTSNLPVALQVNGAETIQSTSGSMLFNADTQDLSIGIGGASTTAGYALNVEGGGNFDNLYVDGSQVCTESSGCGGGSSVATLNGTGPQVFTGNNEFTGTVLDQNAIDSTSAFTVQNAAGDNLFTADTSNDAIDIGQSNAPTNVNIQGSLSVSQIVSGNTLVLQGVGIAGSATESNNLITDSNFTDSSAWTALSANNPWAVAVSGNYAYVVNQHDNTLRIFDITNPYNPTPVSSTNTVNEPYAVAVSGNYAYVTTRGLDTLLIYNISNPASPVLDSSTADEGEDYPEAVTISGNYVYVVSYFTGAFQVYNATNPMNPLLISDIRYGGGTCRLDVAVSGNYAYVTNCDNTLQIFDVSDPTNPVSVGSTATGNSPNSVVVSGNYAYVTNYSSNTLQIFDVSDPTNPVSVGTAATGGYPAAVTVSGNYAYVTNSGDSTLQIFDVSNPTNPVSVGTAATGGNPYSVAIYGNYAYVTNYSSNTLQAFDISDPTNPTTVSTTPTGNSWSLTPTDAVCANAYCDYISTDQFSAVPNVSYEIIYTVSGATQDSCIETIIGDDNDGCASVTNGVQDLVEQAYDTNGLTLNPENAVGLDISNVQVYQVLSPIAPNLQILNDGSDQLDVRASNGNSYIGLNSGENNTSGYNNTALGSEALQNNTTGYNNVAIGYDALTNNTSGSNNIAIGVNAGTGVGYDNLTNATAIGTDATVDQSNSIVLGCTDGINNCPASTNIGIGTNSPQATLDVQGNNTNENAFEVQDANDNNILAVDTVTSSIAVDGAPTDSGYALNVGGSNSTPNVVDVTVNGTGGSTGYQYTIVGINASGNPIMPELGGYTNNANSTLSITNYTSLSWSPISGAVKYDVYRSYYPTQFNTGVIGTTTSTSFDDTGITSDQIPLPTGAIGSIPGNYELEALQSNYAFLITSNSMLIVDISNSSDPTVDSTTTVNDVTGLRVQGNYAYVVTGSTLYVYDISNPANPSLSNTIALGSTNVDDIKFAGNYLYILTDNGGFTGSVQIFDISNPANPSLAGTLAVSGDGSMAISGNYLYAAGYGNPLTLYIYDIANPASPTDVGSMTSAGLYFPDSVAGMATINNRLYIDTSHDFVEMDISNPASPTLIGYTTVGSATGGGTGLTANSLAFSGSYAYVGVNNGNGVNLSGVSIINLSTSQPTFLGYAEVSSGQNTTQGIAIANGLLYMSTYVGQFGIFNLLSGSSGNGLSVTGQTQLNGNLVVSDDLDVGQGIQDTGYGLFQDSSNSATAFQVQNSAGANLLNVDTDNNLVRLGSTSYNTGTISQSGTTVSGSGTTFTSGMVGGTLIYSDGTSALITGYTNVHSITVSISKTVAADSTYQIQYSGVSVSSNGNVLLQTTTNSTTGFQIQNSSGASLLTADTTNMVITITGTLTLNGHLITGNSSGNTTAAAQTDAGSTATCTVTGNDTSGKISIASSGSGQAAGAVCIINFSSAFSASSNPVITATSSNDALVTPYLIPNTSEFTINFGSAPSAGQSYTFDYFNAQ